MANQEIPSLPGASTPLDGTEQLHLVQGGNSRKATSLDILKQTLSTANQAAVRSGINANAAVQTFTSGGHTAVADDYNNFLRFTSTDQTLAMTAAATLGSDWSCWVMADGVAVTIDPNSTETVDGASTVIVPPGHACRVWCTGSAFHTSLFTGALMPAGGTKGDGWRTVSGSPTELDFTGLGSGDYILKIDGVRPATDDSSLRMRVQTGGSTWQTTGYGYHAVLWGAGGSSFFSAGGDSITASMGLTQTHGGSVGVGNATGEGVRIDVKFRVDDTNMVRVFKTSGFWMRPDLTAIGVQGVGLYGAVTAVTGLRLYWNPTTPVAFANVGRVGLFRVRG